MADVFAEMLPKIPRPWLEAGAVCAQYVRCGKPNCRCASGGLHGPYYYRFTREGGRLRKRYVRKAEASAELEKQASRRRLLAMLPALKIDGRERGLLDTMLRRIDTLWPSS
jgi:hypothetical protein